jgi:3-methyladenine DNA glycosylase AlkD
MPLDPRALAGEIEAALRQATTAGRAEQEQAYLKSELDFIGVRIPDLRRVVKAELKRAGDLGGDELVRLARELWRSPIYERRAAAVMVLSHRPRLLAEHHIEVVEEFVRDSETWALVDGLAIDVAGQLLERFPSLESTMQRWSTDADFWIRRSALLAYLRPLRRGEGHFDRFAEKADRMLEEREFFIRKAIGWVLRETAKQRPALVTGWIAPRTHRASGVTMREVTRHLAEADRERLMLAYRERRPAVEASE